MAEILPGLLNFNHSLQTLLNEELTLIHSLLNFQRKPGTMITPGIAKIKIFL